MESEKVCHGSGLDWRITAKTPRSAKVAENRSDQNRCFSLAILASLGVLAIHLVPCGLGSDAPCPGQLAGDDAPMDTVIHDDLLLIYYVWGERMEC